MKNKFEIPPRISPEPPETLNFKQIEQESSKPPFKQENLNLGVFWGLQEGLTKTMVCRVAELVNAYGIVKGFMLKRVIGEVGKKKEQQKEEIKETLDSFVDEDEQI